MFLTELIFSFAAFSQKEWSCVNLTHLNISHNMLKMIPAEISACSKLVNLTANNNRLYCFPTPWDCPLVSGVSYLNNKKLDLDLWNDFCNCLKKMKQEQSDHGLHCFVRPVLPNI